MDEYIYFVDENDEPTGETSEKLAAHTSATRLHAAFSCYVFNTEGKLLVTRRAETKKVWPGVWTNSACGHPSPGEDRQDAVSRRLMYELGMTVSGINIVLPKYIYKTPPYKGIVEHEFCPVFSALATSDPMPNAAEVSEYKWVSWQWYSEQIKQDSSDYSDPESDDAPQWSWWCKDQFKQLMLIENFERFVGKT